VKLYGGFNGTETEIDQRNLTTNISVLSGDIGISDDTSDNSYHVIQVVGPAEPIVLDGFTVTGGNANGDAPYNHGGGIYHYQGTLSVVNTKLSFNYSVILPDVVGNGEGGAIYSTLGSLTLSTSTFVSNTASRGGAIACDGGTLGITDSSFYSNTATSDSGGDGGAIHSNCDSSFVNNTFASNTADRYGGAILTDNDVNEVEITNSTFYGNSSLVGGGVANYGRLKVTNSTFSDNS
jgi:predicted outer membrane repeat protein